MDPWSDPGCKRRVSSPAAPLTTFAERALDVSARGPSNIFFGGRRQGGLLRIDGTCPPRASNSWSARPWRGAPGPRTGALARAPASSPALEQLRATPRSRCALGERREQNWPAREARHDEVPLSPPSSPRREFTLRSPRSGKTHETRTVDVATLFRSSRRSATLSVRWEGR